jgi:alpha-L-fucosidase 2
VRRELIACLWLVVGFCRSLCAQPCPPLEVRNGDGNYVVPGSFGDIAYAPGLALDAYIQQSRRSTPAVVVIHGGRWTAGSRVAHVGQILELLTRAGYHWFSLDYRTGGLQKFEESLTDIRAALKFIRCHAGRLGIDPDRLILLGEDSGAHLAALLASQRPQGVMGAVLLGGFYGPSVSEAGRPGMLEPAAPVARIVRGMPPTLVVHGAADAEVSADEARRYCAKLREATNQCEFVEEPGAGHRVENWWPSQWNYKKSLVRWLARLQPAAARPATFRYGAVQKDIVYDSDSQLTLDACVARSATPAPAVIIVHGGGWEAGDKVTYVTPLFEPLARAGMAWFSIDYRLTPAFRNEDQIDDVRKAVAFVRREHARFKIDPRRIVLLGESASGQMVLQVGASDPSLAGLVSFYGVYDFNAMVNDAGPRSLLVRLFHRNVLDEDARALMRRFSPLQTARRDMPPVLLINGTGERLWDQARAFQVRLREIGARHELIALENAPHGLENWEGHPEWMSYKERLIAWIRDVTR